MTTWENAAADVAREIRDTQIGGYPVPLDAVDNFIDGIKQGGIDQRAGFVLIADEATTVYAVMTGTPRAVALDVVLTTIAEKQADYGPQNILWAGVNGILLRMHDKTARIRNLARREVAGNEPLIDSWLDLVGYSIVGVMLIDGTFEYPLARDMAVGTASNTQKMQDPYKTVPDATGNSTEQFEELAKDPGIASALRQFVQSAALPMFTTPESDDVYNITGGGQLRMVHEEDSPTVAVITDDLGGYFAILAEGDHMHVDANGININTQRAAVILAMLLGATEHSLGWINTTMKAGIPND